MQQRHAERLAHDPAMRAVVDRGGLGRRAASTSQMGRFETGWLTSDANLGLWSPELPARVGAAGQSVAARIEAEMRADAAWPAYINGVRKWDAENGERVLVAFGAAPATSLPSADRSRARDRVLAALQRFAGERIEAASASDDTFIYREMPG